MYKTKKCLDTKMLNKFCFWVDSSMDLLDENAHNGSQSCFVDYSCYNVCKICKRFQVDLDRGIMELIARKCTNWRQLKTYLILLIHGAYGQYNFTPGGCISFEFALRYFNGRKFSDETFEKIWKKQQFNGVNMVDFVDLSHMTSL